MFDQWLDEHREEILDAYVAGRQEQQDPRPTETIRQAIGPVFVLLARSMRGEADWVQGVELLSQRMLEAGLSSAVAIAEGAQFMHRAIREVMQKHRPPESSAWLDELSNQMLAGNVASSKAFAAYTEQKAQEAARRQIESEAEYRRFYDNAPVGFVRSTLKEGQILAANKRIAHMLGYESLEQFMAEYVPSRHHHDSSLRDQTMGELRQKGYVENIETSLLRLDGSSIWVSCSLHLPPGAEYLDGIFTDITARKEMEAEHERLHQELIEAQQRAIAELSTPIIPVMAGIIILPLVGSIDTERAREITRSLLAGISQHRADVVIIDITGVAIVDSGVAGHLDKTIKAARLKGARTIITGISEAVAETIVDLGINWSGLETVNDLQTGLRVALKSLKKS
jgi:PAS domain S-box-containing protein